MFSSGQAFVEGLPGAGQLGPRLQPSRCPSLPGHGLPNPLALERVEFDLTRDLLCRLCTFGSAGCWPFSLLLTCSNITSSETLPLTTLKPSHPLQLGLDPTSSLPPLFPLSGSILFTGLCANGGWSPLEQNLGGHRWSCLCSCNPNTHNSSRRSVNTGGVSDASLFSPSKLRRSSCILQG